MVETPGKQPVPGQPATRPGVRQVVGETVKEKLVRPVETARREKNWRGVLIPAAIILAIIFSGGVTGYLLASRGISQPETKKELAGGAELVTGPKEVGIKDETAFSDSTQGRIEVNDSEVVTEGSHRLIRPGGESKTAYLTSSVINLNQFLGKCVEVWGETFAAQQAGWFMDIGRVKILDKCPEGL